MRIGIETWGSNGDIRPLLALADGLQQSGHKVTLVVSSIDNRSYADYCQRMNIAYQQVPEWINFDMPAFAQKTFRMNTLQWLLALLNEAFFPYEQEIYRAALQLAEHNDLVIGHHFLYPLKLAAKKQRILHVSVSFCHALITTPTQPPFRFPNLGVFLNRIQWRIVDKIFDWTLKPKLSKLWLAENQQPVSHVFADLLTSNQLNLIAVDKVFCEYRQQWDAIHQVCGFLDLPEYAESWQMPEQLKTFLERGAAPIYMTFGSLQQAVPDWSMELFLNAVELSGCRAIIQTSSGKYPENSLSGNVYFIGRHPHQPLFEKCLAVVHHGGAGTTHTASRSGCCSIVVPFMDEQLFWARQVQKLGLAGKPIAAKSATAQLLAERINEVIKSPVMLENAKLIKLKMADQDGVSHAVSIIEEMVEKLKK
jgi:UDP:flavonoid glycosyltransferase YjiC (YdhE family)